MPHFLCPRCASRGHSAARESRCPNCGAPLGRHNKLHATVPRAEQGVGRVGGAPGADAAGGVQ